MTATTATPRRTTRTARGFDRLSPYYDTLVQCFPRRAIPRSQTRFLDRVGDRRRALVIGGGTGAFLVALLGSDFRGRVLNLDISAGMLELARRRVSADQASALSRVEFRLGGVEALGDGERFDLVCTHCFLDLFTAPVVRQVVARLDEALEPGGTWLCSDFVDPAPAGGLRGAAHRTLLRGLYAFFGLTCGIEPRTLPPIVPTLAACGLVPLAMQESAGGLLWSGVWRKPANPG